MSNTKKLVLPLAVFGVIFGIVGMFVAMGRYEARRHSEHLQPFIQRFTEISGKLNDMETLRRLPVAYKDRAQPLDSVARSTLRTLSGKRTLFKHDPVLVYLTLCFDDVETWKDVPLIVVQHGANKELLGMEPAVNLVSLAQVRGSKKFAEHLSKLQTGDTSNLLPVQQEVFVINSHCGELENNFGHMMLVVPPWKGQDIDPQRALDWHLPALKDMSGHPRDQAKIIADAWSDLAAKWIARDMSGVNTAAALVQKSCAALSPQHFPPMSDIEAELSFNRASPITTSSYLFFAAAVFALLGGVFASKALRIAGWSVAAVGMGFILYGFYLRIILGFGVPITNLYESMISIAALGTGVCLVYDIAKKTVWGTVAAGLASFLVLQIVDIYSVKFDAAIGGTVAVLANNFWVYIHVPVVMASYACFFIAFLLSVVGIPWLHAHSDPKNPDPEFKQLVHTIDMSLNVGSIFIFAGLVLGGVWAHDSWGRFWGWDPKETWALILFFWYMFPVHGRFTGYLNPYLLMWWCFGGGAMLLFTYYGTNELLSGLHSYASSAGSGGFWANATHERNRWFIWTMSTLLVSFAGILGLYFMTGMDKKLSRGPKATESTLDPAAEGA